ncbi:MAG: DNA topoisomerase IV subunit A, partial [Rhodospirillaceae bacterium]|nr:DNA topoisomerase IV subunit A [Rhodospirillaceae bacterium]
KDDRASFCLPVNGDSIAIIGENSKLLIFKIEEIPQMTRGRGVILQKYHDCGVSDIKLFFLSDGLKIGKRIKKDLSSWIGKRAGIGYIAPPNCGKKFI